MQLCLGACLMISTAYFQNKVKSMRPLMWKNMADVTQGWRVQIKARTQVPLHLRPHDLCIPTFSNHYITYIFQSCVRHLVGRFMANSGLCCALSSDVRTPWYYFFHSVCGCESVWVKYRRKTRSVLSPAQAGATLNQITSPSTYSWCVLLEILARAAVQPVHVQHSRASLGILILTPSCL